MHCWHVVLKVFSVLLRIWVISLKAFWRNCIEAGVERLVKGEITVGELVNSDGGSTTGSWTFWVGMVSGLVRSSGKTVLAYYRFTERSSLSMASNWHLSKALTTTSVMSG